MAKTKNTEKRRLERSNFINNQAKVREFLANHIKEKKTFPSIREIAAGVGMANTTVKDHLSQMDVEAEKSKISACVPDVIAELMNMVKNEENAYVKMKASEILLNSYQKIFGTTNIDLSSKGEKLEATVQVFKIGDQEIKFE